jgi:hypothetical protein
MRRGPGGRRDGDGGHAGSCFSGSWSHAISRIGAAAAVAAAAIIITGTTNALILAGRSGHAGSCITGPR